ncbi:serine/threonine phosphatase [Leptolyngbya sp. FACHB-261]|uniref:serine/threonine phosphatase n=1 Tax=Leptolyngbya sp. FACHB-261 TaxID=2692806 RepID=UPI001682CCA9|nr:serine/threonine phosphatase [Leptolyngbya sp. FACHB-261]MBD2104595.1 serine/threonine phosphatase [Leptolyngbya sp. FACHB-261]
MIDCPQCGYSNPVANRFCQNCGMALAQPAPSQSGLVGVGTESLPTETPPATPEVPGGVEQAVIQQISVERLGTEQSITEQPITEQLSTEQLGIEQTGIDPLIASGPLPLGAPVESAVGATVTPADELITEPLPEPPLPAEPAGAENSAGATPTIKPSPHPTSARRLIALHQAAGTDVGHRRDHNEDTFYVQTQISTALTPEGKQLESARGLYVLCDGMGGHAAGEVASAMAVETLRDYFQPFWNNLELPGELTLKKAVWAANEAIFSANEGGQSSSATGLPPAESGRVGSSRMGTTLVMAVVHNHRVAIAHVGDSRLYRLTHQGLTQITRDHEVGQQNIDEGLPPNVAYAHPEAYQLTQALGPRADEAVEPSVQFLEISEPTLLLLCSDGLSDNGLIEAYVQSSLLPLLSTQADLETGIAQLLALGNEHNGHDNLTAILIRFDFEAAPTEVSREATPKAAQAQAQAQDGTTTTELT